jgi:hypothetical protein
VDVVVLIRGVATPYRDGATGDCVNLTPTILLPNAVLDASDLERAWIFVTLMS